MTQSGLDLGPYNFGEAIVANFVVNGRGEFADETGSSRGLSNEIDRALLVYLRNSTKALLIGGQTARREAYKQDRRFETFVLTNRLDQPADGLHYFKADSDSHLATQARQFCSKYGGLLVEGGPQLITKLVKARGLDLLCLTTTGTPKNLKKLLRSLFGIEDASLISDQQRADTRFTIWKL